MVFGDSFKNLPIDNSQDLPAIDLKFMDGLKAKKSSKKSSTVTKPPLLHEADSDSDSDSDSDVSENQTNEAKSITLSIKTTLIASIVFILCSNDIVNGVIKTMGMDGIKLLFVKVFLFAILFFIVSYKFL